MDEVGGELTVVPDYGHRRFGLAIDGALAYTSHRKERHTQTQDGAANDNL